MKAVGDKVAAADKTKSQERVTTAATYQEDLIKAAVEVGALCGMSETAVRAIRPDSVITTYTAYESTTATSEDFFSSFVVLIPCYVVRLIFPAVIATVY